MVMPRGLLESGERNRMPPNQSAIRFCYSADVVEKLVAKQAGSWLLWFKGAEAAERFAAVVARHSYGSNLTGPLVEIKIRGTAYVHASIGEVHRTLRIAWKL